jgi:hypothetical protein
MSDLYYTSRHTLFNPARKPGTVAIDWQLPCIIIVPASLHDELSNHPNLDLMHLMAGIAFSGQRTHLPLHPSQGVRGWKSNTIMNRTRLDGDAKVGA